MFIAAPEITPASRPPNCLEGAMEGREEVEGRAEVDEEMAAATRSRSIPGVEEAGGPSWTEVRGEGPTTRGPGGGRSYGVAHLELGKEEAGYQRVNP